MKQCDSLRQTLLTTLMQAIRTYRNPGDRLSTEESRPFQYHRESNLSADIQDILTGYSHQSRWAMLQRLAAGTTENRGDKIHNWFTVLSPILRNISNIKERTSNYIQPLQQTLAHIEQRLTASNTPPTDNPSQEKRRAADSPLLLGGKTNKDNTASHTNNM